MKLDIYLKPNINYINYGQTLHDLFHFGIISMDISKNEHRVVWILREKSHIKMRMRL
jgi:hypothetical protein